jgi:hypothetical protein
MAIDDLLFSKGYLGFDIHLVRQGGQAAGDNQSRPIGPMLFGVLGGVPSPDPLTFTFTTNLPNFTAKKAAYGLDFDTTTGVVTATAAEPPKINGLLIRNFIITASASGASIPIRINIHNKRTEAILTPRQLSIRPDDKPPRFSLLAAFDDGTSGDITEHPGIIWNGTGPFSIDAVSGEIKLNPGVTSGNGSVTAIMPPEVGGGQVTALVEILPRWSTLDVTADILSGPGVDQRSRPDVRNVLILPEGFSSGEDGDFQDIAIKLVAQLTKEGGVLRPFDLLKERFNYFVAWVPPPSSEGATTFLAAFAKKKRTLKGSPVIRGGAVPFPLKPTGPGGTVTTLSELVYVAGLPVRDDPPGTAADYAPRWTSLFGTGVVTFASSVKPSEQNAIVTRWLELKERVVDWDKNSLFSLAGSSRPQVRRQQSDQNTLIDFHPRRGGRQAINGMLARIKSRNPATNTMETIGTMWSDPTSVNKDFVLFICRAPYTSGTRFINTVGTDSYQQAAFSLTDETEPIFITRLNSEFAALTDVTAPMTLAGCASAAHETGHLIHLGDEYANIIGRIPTGNIGQTNSKWNLVPETVVGQIAGGGVDTSLIRWKWPKTSKAAVLRGPLRPVGAGFEADVGAGEARAFTQKDRVALRAPGLVPFSFPSVHFEVGPGKPNVATDVVPLTVVRGTAPTTMPPAGTILFGLTVMSTPDVDGNDVVTLMHRDVLASMTTKGALTRKPAGGACDLTGDTPDKSDGPQPPVNAPKGLLRYGTKLIGLYDGGQVYRCGVFHAAGDCQMRASQNDRVVPFCHVCRYIIVDQFYPAGHGAIDAAFAFPKVKP